MPRTEDDYECEVLRMEKPLRAYLHRLAPQPADLEDLLQDTYSHLFRLTPEQRRAIVNVPAFAMTAARNIALNWIRHKRVVRIDSVEDMGDLSVIDDGADLEAIVHSHQQLVRLAEGVSRLPDRCRDAFSLRHVYGLSQKEIAQRMGVTEGAVEQLLVRGMRRCLEQMEQPAAAGGRKAAVRRSGLLDRWKRMLKGAEEQG